MSATFFRKPIDQYSPALQCLIHLWRHRHNPTQVNERWQMAAMLISAIKMRLRFDKEDFIWLITNTRASYCDLSPFGRVWLGDGERFYTSAVESQNISAMRAIEHWKQRPAFRWGKETLHVGWQTWWEAKQEHVHCSSFSVHKDEPIVNLISWKAREDERCVACRQYLSSPRREVLHRYRLTAAHVAEASIVSTD